MENESRPSGPEAWQERVASQPARLGASDGLRNEPQEVVIKPRKSAADNGLIGTFYLKRYRGTWLLLSFFILVLAVAALIFPRRPPADQPPPFGVLFEVTPATQTVTMTFTKMAAGNQYELAISLITVPESAALKRPAKVFAYISISLPPGSLWQAVSQPHVPCEAYSAASSTLPLSSIQMCSCKQRRLTLLLHLTLPRHSPGTRTAWLSRLGYQRYFFTHIPVNLQVKMSAILRSISSIICLVRALIAGQAAPYHS